MLSACHLCSNRQYGLSWSVVMRRFIFYWFTFKLVCCRGPCPCFARKRYPERTAAQGSTRYKYRQSSSFLAAAVHQHSFTGKVTKIPLGRGREVSFRCQWHKGLRMSLVDADGKGTRQDCSLAHCYKKWFCGEKAGNNTPIRMVLPNNK